MANPIKIVARIVGGISGKGAKNVNPVYKETGGHVKVMPGGTKRTTLETKRVVADRGW